MMADTLPLLDVEEEEEEEVRDRRMGHACIHNECKLSSKHPHCFSYTSMKTNIMINVTNAREVFFAIKYWQLSSPVMLKAQLLLRLNLRKAVPPPYSDDFNDCFGNFTSNAIEIKISCQHVYYIKGGKRHIDM